MAGSPALLVATRKGAFLLKADASRRCWKECTAPPAFPKAAEGKKAHVLDHTLLDPAATPHIVQALSGG